MKQCTNCNAATGPIAELLRIYESDDAPRMMSILTETIATDKNLHPDERSTLAHIMQLINSVMEEKLADQKLQITELKKTA